MRRIRTSAAPASAGRDIGRIVGLVVVFYLAWVGFSLGVQHLPAPAMLRELLPLLTLGLHLGFAALALALFHRTFSRIFKAHPRLRLALIAFCVLVALALYGGSRWLVLSPSVFVDLFGTANLLLLAMVVGSWMTTALSRPAELVPVCLVMSLVDIFSVSRGPSRFIAGRIEEFYLKGREGLPPVGDFLLIKMTLPGGTAAFPVFGVSDWIIVAFLALAAARFEYNDNLLGPGLATLGETKRPALYFPLPAAALLLAVLLAQFTGIFLPALPFISVLFLAFLFVRYPASRQLLRTDWMLVLTAFGVMAALMLLPPR